MGRGNSKDRASLMNTYTLGAIRKPKEEKKIRSNNKNSAGVNQEEHAPTGDHQM